MSQEDENHRTTVLAMRAHVRAKGEYFPGVIADLRELDEAHEAHIRSKTDFHVANSDRTMINLIGTWARLSRVMWKLEDKYGKPR